MAKVKHIVLLKFKDGTTEEQTSKFFDDLLDLSESISGIDDYVSGFNNSPEERAQGLTHGFIMTFADAAARDAYVVHPDHEKFKNAALEMVEDVVIFDFEV
jgi:UDP-N-acetyl-D-mannosaminuronate dehydrogenase